MSTNSNNENAPRTLKGDLTRIGESIKDNSKKWIVRGMIGSAALYGVLGWADTTVEARGVQTVTVESGQSLREDLAEHVEGYEDLTPGERQALAHMVGEESPDDGNSRTLPESAIDADDFFDLTDDDSWDKEAAAHDFEK